MVITVHSIQLTVFDTLKGEHLIQQRTVFDMSHRGFIVRSSTWCIEGGEEERERKTVFGEVSNIHYLTRMCSRTVFWPGVQFCFQTFSIISQSGDSIWRVTGTVLGKLSAYHTSGGQYLSRDWTVFYVPHDSIFQDVELEMQCLGRRRILKNAVFDPNKPC